MITSSASYSSVLHAHLRNTISTFPQFANYLALPLDLPSGNSSELSSLPARSFRKNFTPINSPIPLNAETRNKADVGGALPHVARHAETFRREWRSRDFSRVSRDSLRVLLARVRADHRVRSVPLRHGTLGSSPDSRDGPRCLFDVFALHPTARIPTQISFISLLFHRKGFQVSS